VKLTGLSVRRMPGFDDRGFDLGNLSSRLNLIVHPNASGKTTTCKAIRGLLWPETLGDLAPVSAGWVLAGKRKPNPNRVGREPLHLPNRSPAVRTACTSRPAPGGVLHRHRGQIFDFLMKGVLDVDEILADAVLHLGCELPVVQQTQVSTEAFGFRLSKLAEYTLLQVCKLSWRDRTSARRRRVCSSGTRDWSISYRSAGVRRARL